MNRKSRFDRRIKAFVALIRRRNPVVLVATAALLATAVVGVARLEVDSRFDVFMPPSSESRLALEATKESFGDVGQLIALVESDHDRQSLALLHDLAIFLENERGVAAVEPPVPEALLSVPDEEFDDALEVIRTVTDGATLPVHDGTTYAVLRIMLDDEADARTTVRAIESRFRDASMTPILSGEPYLEAKVFDYVLRILLILPPIAVVLVIAVFFVRIGSLRATVYSMIPAVLGAALTLGGLAWIAGSVSIVSVLVPIFIIVLGSADGLHITSHVIDECEAGADVATATERTLRAVGVPIILTTVTTALGFLSLLAINSHALQGMAVAAAGGVTIAGLATWFVLPAILMRSKPLRRRLRRGGENRERLASALGKLRGAPAAILAVAILIGTAPGIAMISSDFSMIDVYKRSTEVRRNLDTVRSVIGGAIPVYVTYRTADPLSEKTARAILAIQDKAGAAGLVSHSVSVYSVIRNAYEASGGGTGYPADRAKAAETAEAISELNPRFFGPFTTNGLEPAKGEATGRLTHSHSHTLGRAVFFLVDLSGETVDAFSRLVESEAASSGVKLNAVGSAFVIQEMNDQIVPQQLWSLVLAVVVVFLLTTISQQNVARGAIATVPIIITLTAVFGTMGYVGIDLSVITGIISGLTVGVGIDYAIHFLGLYRHGERIGVENPADYAHSYVATPVLANALGLAVGFTAMAFSPLSIHVTLSILMWLTMTVSAVVTLSLLPTLTATARQPTRPTDEQSVRG